MFTLDPVTGGFLEDWIQCISIVTIVETIVANHTYHHIPTPLQGVPTKPYDTL